MKSFLLILFSCLTCFGFAQSYEKDWEKLNKKIEANGTPSLDELRDFESKYKTQFKNYPDNSVQFYTLLANHYYQSNDVYASSQYYVEAYQFSKMAKDSQLVAITGINLAYFYEAQNYLEQSKTFYEASLAGLAKIYGANSKDYTEVYKRYIQLLIELGYDEQAKPGIEALLYYYKTLEGENTLTYTGLLASKAILAQHQGHYEDAIGIYKQLAEGRVALKLGDTLGYVICLSNLGDVYRETGRFEEALAEFKKTIPYFKYASVKKDIIGGTVYNNMGLCYKSMSQYKESEQHYDKAIAEYTRLDLTKAEAYLTVLSNKADLYRGLGRFYEASLLLNTCLTERKERFGEDSKNYANATVNLGLVYYDAGYLKESLKLFLKADTIYKKTIGEKHQAYGNNLNNLSLCYQDLKDYKKAEDYKTRALQIIEQSVGKDHYRYASFLVSTCQLYYHSQNIAKAESNLKEAMQLVEKNFGKKHDLYAHAQLLLAEVYAKQQQFEKALPLYNSSVKHYSKQLNDYFYAMSEEYQAAFLTGLLPSFQSYVSFLVQYRLHQPSADISDALKLATRHQLQIKSLLASNSSSLLKKVKAKSTDRELQNLYQDWLLLKNELINNYKSTQAVFDDSELQLKANDVERKIKQKIPAFEPSSFLDADSIRACLKPEEAAIELVETSESINDSTSLTYYAAIVIRKDKAIPELIIYKNGNDMEKVHFSNYYQRITNQEKDSSSYAYFFKPLESALTGIKKIYLSAEGVFHKINLLGLLNPTSNTYVWEQYEIYKTATLASITKAKKTNKELASAALFGYPDYEYDFKKKLNTSAKQIQAVATRYGLSGLAKLPGTKTEVEEIDKILRLKNYKVNSYLNERASEQNLRKVQSPGILHIATHGYFLKDIENDDKLILGFENSRIKDNRLLRSGLILAGVGPATSDTLNHDSENDGVVTAAEASLLNLTETDLAVLSACQTGLGENMGSEGVAGLQRSFSIAGVKQLIMSLWPVDDAATQLLMSAFYRNYAQSGSAEIALRAAQKTVKEKYPHPYYWAAFELLKTFN